MNRAGETWRRDWRSFEGIYRLESDFPVYAGYLTPHAAETAPTFEVLTTLNAKQHHALNLLLQITL